AITRLIPLNVIVTFFMWIVIQPDVLNGYMAEPLRAAGIFAAMLGAVIFAMRLQDQPVSRHAIRALGPVILMSGLGVVFAKIALDSAGVASQHSAVFGYMTVQAFFMILIFGALETFWQPVPRAVFTGRVAMQTGFLMGLNTIVHMVFKSYAYQSVENPAYVSAVILVTPLIVLLYYKLFKGQTVGNLKAGFMILLCAAVMVYLISM
ncbi:MAG: putative rane protein, partial [Micavibrio sp.]|nr:putative rane protein [Micavibrio sp.]